MNTDDVTDVLRFLAGHWPNPEMGDDEIRVWTRTLSTCDVQCSIDTIDLLSKSGRTWRPNDGEFIATYRQLKSRQPQPQVDREDVRTLPVTTERKTTPEWIETIRNQCVSLNGPLSSDFGSITGGIPLDPRNPFPESVHARGMARARQMTAERNA